MKILVTAFDPFGGEKINPALESSKAIGEYDWRTYHFKVRNSNRLS